MAAVLAETGVASCLMHNRKDTDYKDYLNDVVADLDETMKMAKEAGIKKETIMLDPGIGFAKDLDQNLGAYEPSGVIKSVGMYQFFLEHLENP